MFRRLLACMPAAQPSISVFPLGLKTAAPVLGTPDFTEDRIVPRPFPKDAEERNCYQYLLEQMQATPDLPHRTQRRSRGDLPRAISCNGGQLQLLLAGGH